MRLLDTPIYKLHHRAIPKSDRTLGLELEVECGEPFPEERGWDIHNEDSIEGGLELVTRHPTNMKNLVDRIAVLEEWISTLPQQTRDRAEDNYRCSTHVHVGVSDLTLRQVYNVMGLWYLFEDYVVGTQPASRYTSAFALRASASKILHSQLGKPNFINYADFYEWKYFALNWVSVANRGTLEFRFLPLILDTRKLCFWVDFFVTFVESSKDKDIHKIILDYQQIPVEEFARKHLCMYEEIKKMRGREIKAAESDRNLDLVITLSKGMDKPVPPVIFDEEETSPDVPYALVSEGDDDE